MLSSTDVLSLRMLSEQMILQKLQKSLAQVHRAGISSGKQLRHLRARAMVSYLVMVISGTQLRTALTQGWIVDGKLNIDPKREEFLDISKKLKDNDYHNDTQDWQDAWFADMKGEGEKQIFGFFGPAWLINYTLAPNCGGEKVGEGTYGDWAVCAPPVGFFWGGTWVMANKDSEKKEAVGQIIDWITLNCTEDGLQYMWANGTLNGEGGTKDCVASGTVMDMSDGTLDFLGGQNMFDVFGEANSYANGKNLTQYDETINQYWRDQVRQYTAGEKDQRSCNC